MMVGQIGEMWMEGIIVAALPLVAIDDPTERRRRKFQDTQIVDWNGGDERQDATFLHSTPLAVI
jgi:hypothetical protein